MSSEYAVLPHDGLRRFATAVLEAGGVPAPHAALIGDSLVASNLRGVDSHGVQLILFYLTHIENGNVNVGAQGRVAHESGGAMVYDGENGLGQVVSAACCEHVIRLARGSGLGMVTARESNHFGAAAYWAQRIARAGLIGLVMCNATPLVNPWQGREKRFGTNPICMALPGPEIFLLDMATTTVALNKIYKAVLGGKDRIPEGWALDPDGNPTTDPKLALEGTPMPLGGYKGSGLAMMAEILSAVLSGGAMSTELGGIRVHEKPMRVGHFFLGIEVERFLPMDDFVDRMTRLREMVKNTAPAPGFDEVLIAGEPEWREEARRRERGIPLDLEIWKQLVEAGAARRVPAPEARITSSLE